VALESVDLRALMLVTSALPAHERGDVLFLGRPRLFFDWLQVRIVAAEFGVSLDESGDAPLTPHSLAFALGFSRVLTVGLDADTDLHLDLTGTMPTELVGRFTIVVDAGVLYWCFDPGMALRNIRSMVREGGSIVHVTAITGFLGRGYYAIQPRVLFAFYEANGGVCCHAVWRPRPRRNIRKVVRRLLRKSRIDTGRGATPMTSGDFFWGRTHVFGHPGFHANAKMRATRRIPNDVLGTYVFKVIGGQRSGAVTLLEDDVS
jgi:hypothetical protein